MLAIANGALPLAEGDENDAQRNGNSIMSDCVISGMMSWVDAQRNGNCMSGMMPRVVCGIDLRSSKKELSVVWEKLNRKQREDV